MSAPTDVVNREQRLDDLIAAYLEQTESGRINSADEWANRHPEFRDELREFIEQRERLERWAAPLRAIARPAVDEGCHFLGDFQLISEVGRGGMGIVYQAQQLSLQRRVAVKVLPFAGMLDSRQLQRFKNEAHAAALLDHPHLVNAFFVGCERGTHFYAMRYIDGPSLAQLITIIRHIVAQGQTQSLPEQQSQPVATLVTQYMANRLRYFRAVAQFGLQAASALGYAHQRAIVHRDIKPSNLLLDSQGQLWVTDFGLATVHDSADLTMTGDVIGTLRYMSPEQAAGKSAIVDHRIDIYSLGITLYELLTLQPAFSDHDRPTLLHRISRDEPATPRSIDASIPVDLQTILLKSIAKAPGDRYVNAEALADDLQRFLDQRPIQARHIGRIARTWRWCRRSPAFAGLVGAVCLLSVGIAAGGICLAYRETKQRQEAETRRKEAEWQQYVSDMHGAMAAWEDSNVGRVVQLLERHQARPGGQDYRGFEWHYLWKKCEQGQAELSIAHPSLVRSVAVSPDGKTLATAADDHVVRLWNSRTGTLEVTWFPDADRIEHLAFSPSGDDLAGACGGETIRIWDVKRRRERLCLSGHTYGVLRLCYAPDGSLLYSWGWDNTVRTWDAVTGRLLHTIAVRGGPLVSPEVNHLWMRMLAYSDQIQLVDTTTGDILKAIDRPEFSATVVGKAGVAVSRQLGITGGHDGVVRFFRLRDGRDLYSEAIHRRIANSIISISADERFCATGDIDGLVVVWDLETLRAHSVLRGHTGQIWQTAWWPDGRRLVSGGDDGWLKVWNLDRAPSDDVYRGHNGFVQAVAFHPSSKWLVTGGEIPDKLVVWDVANKRESADLMAGHTDQVRGLAFSHDGQELASVSDDGTLRVWDFHRRVLWRTILVSPAGLRSVVYSPDDRELLVSDYGGWIHVYGRDADQPRLQQRVGSSTAECLAFSPDGTKLAVTVDGTVAIADYPTCKRWQRFSKLLRSSEEVVFTPDGRQLVCGGRDDQKIVIYSLDGMEPVVLASPAGIQSLDISPNGQTLAAAGNDHHVRLWDLEHREVRALLRGHSRWVSAMRFSPDGQMLATGSDDGTMRLWRGGARTIGVRPDPERLRTIRPPTSAMIEPLRVADRWTPQQDNWEAGIESLQTRLRQFPEDSFGRYQLAILQLHLGRRAEYQVQVSELLSYFERTMSSTQLSYRAERIAVVCLIDGTSAEQYAHRLRPLLTREPTSSETNHTSSLPEVVAHWNQLALGWTHLRLGDHAAAIAVFHELVSQNQINPLLNAMAQLGLAGAHRVANDVLSAKQAAAAAAEYLTQHRRWVVSQPADVPHDWQDLLMCEIVQREMEQVLNK